MNEQVGRYFFVVYFGKFKKQQFPSKIFPVRLYNSELIWVGLNRSNLTISNMPLFFYVTIEYSYG